MGRFRLNSKIKGVISVSASNLLAFGLSMLTSFLLPIFVSVSEYGYWQLFWLYTPYVGFMALGFNDGIHLNYAKSEYDSGFIRLFGLFRSFIFRLSFIETIVLVGLLIVFKSTLPNSFVFNLLVILNIIPTLVLGFFTYSNQCTLRFKQYSTGNIVDKVIFGVAMISLLCCGCKKIIYYIWAFTISKYLAIIYHYVTSRELFTKQHDRFVERKTEIRENFTNGFPLMIACIFGGSTIIVGGRLLVEHKYGIETFSAYSFALHTLVIASQFISAIATVFYPIMKRTAATELRQLYKSFDKVSALLSLVLLLSYYVIVVAIKLIYPKYDSILEYLFVIYPLFIYQCKSSLLIINMYKVENRPVGLIFINIVGFLINFGLVYISYLIFDSVFAIASATLLGYMLWYYLCTIIVYRREKWRLSRVSFFDSIYIILFLLINIISNGLFENSISCLLSSCLIWIVLISTFAIIMRKDIKRIISEFNYLLRD